MITKDGSHSSHRDLWVSNNVQGGGGEMNMMKIKSNKVSIV